MAKVTIRNGKRGRHDTCYTWQEGSSLKLRSNGKEQTVMLGQYAVDVAVDILNQAPALQCATDPRLRRLAKMWLEVPPNGPTSTV